MDNPALRPLLEDADRLARVALTEDGARDVSSEASVNPELRGEAVVEARADGILAGRAYADAVVSACGLRAITWSLQDGEAFVAGKPLGVFSGSLRAILRAERPALNLLQRACGIATTTKTYVLRLQGTGCRLLHTRKTLPGLRAFDVRAVLAGGGLVHRVDLAHTAMIKDNHWRALESGESTLADALELARAGGVASVQVEVETEAQLEAACAAGANRILIDNQSPETFRAWAARARALSPAIEVEASGGLDLETVRVYADAGADFVSVGALTHSVRALDIALAVTPTGPRNSPGVGSLSP